MKSPTDRNFEKYGVILMALALIAVTFSSPLIAHAECGHGEWGKMRHGEFFEARIKSLHDKLQLSGAQETSWADFVAKSAPDDHHPNLDRSELSKMPTPERLDHLLSMMKERQQRMESRAQAVKTFYAGLTPEQQKIFDASFFPNRENHDKH